MYAKFVGTLTIMSFHALEWPCAARALLRSYGAASGHVDPMFRPHRYEKAPGQQEAIRAQKTRYSVTL